LNKRSYPNSEIASAAKSISSSAADFTSGKISLIDLFGNLDRKKKYW